MTKIVLVQSETGLFRSCVAEGHAGFAKKGSDIVCSSISVLLRTTIQVLSNKCGTALKTFATERGKLEFFVEDVSSCDGSPSLENVLLFAKEFLVAGFSSLSKEYPCNVEFTIKTEL
ncbi:MAG: ribosomal-processing cysteine protease Prp [Treponema sp.]|nr:ribosomal-processing cysteine protease Prp [Treponema sp.]